MNLQYTPYVWYLIVSTVASAALGGYAWRHRSVPAAPAFALLSITTVLWSLANALEMTATGLAAKTLWANIQYISYAFVPLACFNLAVQYTGRGWWLTRRKLALLSIMPMLTVLLVWTNPLHGLIRRNVRLDTAGPFPVIAKTYGPWFWAFAIYSYALIVIALGLFATHLLRTVPAYHGQVLALLAGLMLPVVCSALYTAGLSPVPRHDITPAAFGISGAVIAWGLFRHRLFDIVPIAYANIISNMSDGIVLLDSKGRIVEINPAAQGIFGVSFGKAAGRECREVLRGWPEPPDLSGGNEIVLDPGRHYEVYSSPLTDARSRPCGSIVVVHDVTENRNTQVMLMEHQRELAVAEEREHLAREMHDSMGQTLGYINVQAQAIQELVLAGQIPAALQQLERLTAVAREAHTSVRGYIRDMRERTSPGLGFLAALREMAARFEHQTGVRIDLSFSGPTRDGMFSPGAEIQILGIVREALANVRKHARATEVHVEVATGESDARITIRDDGCGFERERARAGNGHRFGLDIMRKRAEEAGGAFEVRPVPGEGTTVIVSVPLSGGRTERENTAGG